MFCLVTGLVQSGRQGMLISTLLRYTRCFELASKSLLHDIRCLELLCAMLVALLYVCALGLHLELAVPIRGVLRYNCVPSIDRPGSWL